jgi:hypothetical protein
MDYDENRRHRIWAGNVDALYEQAKARQWNATTDVPWEEGQDVDPAVEHALAEVLTWMIQQEYAAWYVPAKFLTRINPAFSEVSMFLSTQVVDEARHAEVFLKRAELNGVGLQEAMPSTEAILKGLLRQDDFDRASFLLHVLGDGTFKDLFHLLIDVAPDPATRTIMERALEDEARHVAYGVHRLQNRLEAADDPDAVGEDFHDALEQRLSFTYEVSGIPNDVQDALVVVAGGGETSLATEEGEALVEQLGDDLTANRKERLRKAGFSRDVVERISDLHVRSSGGLM